MASLSTCHVELVVLKSILLNLVKTKQVYLCVLVCLLFPTLGNVLLTDSSVRCGYYNCIVLRGLAHSTSQTFSEYYRQADFLYVGNEVGHCQAACRPQRLFYLPN